MDPLTIEKVNEIGARVEETFARFQRLLGSEVCGSIAAGDFDQLNDARYAELLTRQDQLRSTMLQWCSEGIGRRILVHMSPHDAKGNGVIQEHAAVETILTVVDDVFTLSFLRDDNEFTTGHMNINSAAPFPFVVNSDEGFRAIEHGRFCRARVVELEDVQKLLECSDNIDVTKAGGFFFIGFGSYHKFPQSAEAVDKVPGLHIMHDRSDRA